MPFTEYARTFKYTYQASQVHTGKKKELGRPRMRLKSPMSSGHKYVARVVFGSWKRWVGYCHGFLEVLEESCARIKSTRSKDNLS